MVKLLLFSLASLIFSLTLNPATAKETLFVNEIVASNSAGIKDNSGAAEDWFEIYNPNNYEVDIGGYFLSDKTNNPTKYQLPTGNNATKIPAKGFLIIWASGEVSRGPLHVSFSLSDSGENVVISSPAQELIDAVTFGAQLTDVSYGRNPDGTANWSSYSTPTPGSTNSGGTIYAPKLAVPVFSEAAGFKTSGFNLTITHPEPGVTIRYTLDGSEPVNSSVATPWKYKNKYNDTGGNYGAGGVNDGLSDDTYKSDLYENPIAITNRAGDPNKISMKTSSITYTPGYLPATPIYKGTVVRVKVFKTGFTPSETVTRTYFVNPSGGSKYSVPVISIASTETSFFDYTSGIYTPGKVFDQYRQTNSTAAGYCTVGNFTESGDLWERPGNIEFFDGVNSILNQAFDFRIHGGCSRSLSQKTLRLYSKTEFNFAVFPEAPTRFPKRLLLRNSGNDNNSTLFRDSYFQKLVQNLSFDTQLSRPAIVFLNSEYWGIQNITERYDKYYLEKKYNVDGDNVDLIDVELPEIEEGDLVKYNELLAFANNNSFVGTTNYDLMKTMIDIENFTDYQIAEIFSANTDWPHKNTRLWRNKVVFDPNANVPYGHDGRWRWMLYDTDITLGLNVKADNNSIPNAISGGAPSVILRKLLENADYKTYFINRLADLLNTTLLSSRAVTLLNNTKGLYTGLIQEHRDRWNSPASIAFWNQSIGEMQTFMEQRPPFLRGHLRQSFNGNLTNMNLTVDVNDADMGYVKVNTIDILPTTDGLNTLPYPWTGIYFQNNPMKLTAIAKPGNHFVRWERAGSNVGTTTELPVTATVSALSYKAIFEAGALPVVLKSFDAKKENTKVVLKWETSSEVNNDYFVVERSSDALAWSDLATVKGAETTKDIQSYRTADEQPLSNVNYYRLKQVDFDKTSTYSSIVSVDMGNFKITNIWPNPVSDFLNITLDQAFEQAQYEITDINGRPVRRFQKLSSASAVKLSVGNLASGTYIINIKTKDGASHSSRFVKL